NSTEERRNKCQSQNHRKSPKPDRKCIFSSSPSWHHKHTTSAERSTRRSRTENRDAQQQWCVTKRALNIGGSFEIHRFDFHPLSDTFTGAVLSTMGRRQVVRHRFLVPAFGG